MGSSLADRTWGRESAVYRITGVMAVISGWVHHRTGRIPHRTGRHGPAALGRLDRRCGTHGSLRLAAHPQPPQDPRVEGPRPKRPCLPLEKAETPDEVLCACIGEVCNTMQEVTRIYNRTLVAVFKENRKVLKEMVRDSERLFSEARERKYNIMPTLRRLQQCDIDTGHFYVQVVDYLSEVTKALIHITRPSSRTHRQQPRGHVEGADRRPDALVNDQVEEIFDKINEMLASKDFTDLDRVLDMRDRLFDTIVEAVKSQLRRINSNPSTSTRASVLYLTILNETKTMVLQSRNLLKSQHYFLESQHEIAPSRQ